MTLAHAGTTAAPSGDPKFGLLRALATRIDRTDPGACNNLGVLYYSKSMYAEAAGAFFDALAIAPRMRVAARNLAVVATHPGACDAPIHALEAQLHEQPDNTDARVALARLFRLLEREPEARAQLMRALEYGPTHVHALREFGLLEQHAGALRNAQDWYQRALAVQPDDTSARMQLAEVYYHRGSNHHALEELDQLLQFDATLAEAHLLRAFVLGDLGDSEAATEAAARAHALDPALASLEPDLSLDARGGTAAAPHAGALPVTRGLRETPLGVGAISNQSLARHGLGLAFRQRGYFTEARREFERALAGGEDKHLVRHALAELDLAEGAHESAVSRYRELLVAQPEDAKLWNELGVALHQGGDLAAACDAYRHALSIDPTEVDASSNLGVALHDRGSTSDAQVALEHAIRIAGDTTHAVLSLARLHLAGGRNDAAHTLLQPLVERPRVAPAIWHEFGVTQLALSRLDAARDALTAAIEGCPDDGESRYVMAELLGRTGDLDGALRETQMAMQFAPMRVPRRLAVSIALQRECQMSVGRLNLLTLRALTPLAGARVNAADVMGLLPELGTLHVAPAHDDVSMQKTSPQATTVCASLEQELERAELAMQEGRMLDSAHYAASVLQRCDRFVRALDPTLEADALRLTADGFAARGVHGEAFERYAQVRALANSAANWPKSVRAAGLQRRSLLGELRSACLLGMAHQVLPLVDLLGGNAKNDPDALAVIAAINAARDDRQGEHVARVAIDCLLQLNPASPALMHFAGDAAARLLDSSLAIMLYRRALVLDPTRPSPRVAIATLLLARGERMAAELELVAALASSPSLASARVLYARLLLEAARPQDAVRELSGHLQRYGPNVALLVLLAEALHLSGRVAEARQAVQRARRFEPDHPHALFLDGRLLSAQGREREARSRWGRLLATSPGSEWSARIREEDATRGSLAQEGTNVTRVERVHTNGHADES